MSVQTTSKIAYKEISKDGTTSKQSKEILDAVSLTGSSLKEISKKTGIEINAVSGRVHELKNKGVLEVLEKRKCTITGRLVSPVIITGKGKGEKPKTLRGPGMKHIKEYEVHATGADRKTSVKTIIKARDPQEAGKIAMIFCKVAGVTFSHTKVKV